MLQIHVHAICWLPLPPNQGHMWLLEFIRCMMGAAVHGYQNTQTHLDTGTTWEIHLEQELQPGALLLLQVPASPRPRQDGPVDNDQTLDWIRRSPVPLKSWAAPSLVSNLI